MVGVRSAEPQGRVRQFCCGVAAVEGPDVFMPCDPSLSLGRSILMQRFLQVRRPGEECAGAREGWQWK